MIGYNCREVITLTIGENIREARKKAGLTQDELADKIGVQHSAIHKYESGIVTNIPIDRIRSIAQTLNVPMAYLLGDVSSPEDWSKIHLMESSNPDNKEKSKKPQEDENKIPSEYASFFAMKEIMAKIEEDAANTYIIHGSQGKGTVVKSVKKDKGDILPAEFNDFSIFIGKMDYTISLEKGMYYLINGDKRIKITPDDLKTLVRTSKAMIRGLLEDIMNRE